MSTTGLTAADLVEGWGKAGVEEGMTLIVHASLSSLGPVAGGAATVVESLRTAVGPAGTLVMPAFTWQVTDPAPDHKGVPDAATAGLRAAVPAFHPDLPSTEMGAISETLRTLPDSVRSSHPQASVAAVGARAAEITAAQPLGFAIGPASPFGRIHELGGHILLIGVGHNRNTFLHYAETLTPRPRLKLRRFPLVVDGERVWAETVDVGNDNGRHFPTVGREFEEFAGLAETTVGGAPCRLVPLEPFVPFAVRRLTELLAQDEDQASAGPDAT
ncbi:aminoglycoside N(3)-acetyltransferase [Streptomyces sp. NBC_01465]|uniref:aminoglycoside N(3)-acetyltransferase n=1 Tax=Streptomyces sp. NBC_01465 TaxID=2903878 RepID=UPI002E37C362|nr:AAC(3) family N-acetyltransferase [Streptomyces sp. NBC_01465]